VGPWPAIRNFHDIFRAAFDKKPVEAQIRTVPQLTLNRDIVIDLYRAKGKILGLGNAAPQEGRIP
jgi:hypothetical protein